jgi:hypothetical protein
MMSCSMPFHNPIKSLSAAPFCSQRMIADDASVDGTPRETKSARTTSGVRIDLFFRLDRSFASDGWSTPARSAPAAAVSSSSETSGPSAVRASRSRPKYRRTTWTTRALGWPLRIPSSVFESSASGGSPIRPAESIMTSMA